MISHSEKATREREQPAGTIRSVEKVIDILELLARESRGLALGDLARRLDLNASTVHHLLATLKGRGLVTQDERTKMYRIGHRLVGMVNRFLSGTDLYPAGISPVEELRDLSGETSYLTVIQRREAAVILTLTGARPIQARRLLSDLAYTIYLPQCRLGPSSNECDTGFFRLTHTRTLALRRPDCSRAHAPGAGVRLAATRRLSAGPVSGQTRFR